MTHKLAALLAVLIGLVLVAALAALGMDLWRATHTGPRWRRRLVEAGLLALAMLGLPALGEDTPAAHAPADAVATEAQQANLTDSPDWRIVVEAWHEAEDVAAGRRGAYPFDQAGKDRMLSSLEDAGRRVAALQTAGLLSAAEAGLLQKDLEVLRHGVQAKRPTEMQQWTCYFAGPMPFMHSGGSVARLSARLPMLEQLAGLDTLRPEVVWKTLGTVERDLEVLSNEELVGRLGGEQRDQALEIRARAAKQVEVIRQRLRGDAVEVQDTDEWALVVEAWKVAAPLAKTGKSTTAQREAASQKLAAARAAAQKLGVAGLLSRPEAELLIQEADSLLEQIYRNPPTDCRVTCYDMAYLPPARQSLDRLQARAELLERLAASGRASADVLEKVSATIEADLKTLSSEAELKLLRPEERTLAPQVCGRVQQTINQIRQMLRFEVGQKVSYSGIARNGKKGVYVSNLGAQPEAVHLEGEQDGLGKRLVWEQDYLGKRVVVTGVLRMTMTGSDDPGVQAPRQPVFYMDKYAVSVSAQED